MDAALCWVQSCVARMLGCIRSTTVLAGLGRGLNAWISISAWIALSIALVVATKSCKQHNPCAAHMLDGLSHAPGLG